MQIGEPTTSLVPSVTGYYTAGDIKMMAEARAIEERTKTEKIQTVLDILTAERPAANQTYQEATKFEPVITDEIDLGIIKNKLLELMKSL